MLTASTEEQLLRIWVVLDSVQLARLYFAESSGQRFLVRDVPLRHGLDEFGRENVAQVLVTSAKAFMGYVASSTVDEVVTTLKPHTPQANPPAAVRTEPTREAVTPNLHKDWFVRLGTFYGVHFERGNVPSHGPGLLFGAGHEASGARWAGIFKAQYLWPTTVQGTDVDISLRVFAMRLAFVMDWTFAGPWSAGFETGGGLDYVIFNPSAISGDAVTARDKGAHIKPVTWLGLRMSLLEGNWRWTLLPGITTSLVRTHYDIIRQGQSQTQFAPWIVQPSIALELTWQ